MRGFFFYESAEKVLSYARLNCAVFNYFYMSLGLARHTIVGLFLFLPLLEIHIPVIPTTYNLGELTCIV